jgi:hypothetical protein
MMKMAKLSSLKIRFNRKVQWLLQQTNVSAEEPRMITALVSRRGGLVKYGARLATDGYPVGIAARMLSGHKVPLSPLTHPIFLYLTHR